MKKYLTLISVLFFCLSSCKDDLDVAFDRDEFVRNRHQWEELNIKNYTFEYRNGGLMYIEPCMIVVRDGKIQKLIPKDDRYPTIEGGDFKWYLTIDDIFKRIENVGNDPILDKQDKNTYWYCSEILVEYDETYHYPKYVAFNHRGKNMEIADTDSSIEIIAFEVE